jgi:hypothetical protein
MRRRWLRHVGPSKPAVDLGFAVKKGAFEFCAECVGKVGDGQGAGVHSAVIESQELGRGKMFVDDLHDKEVMVAEGSGRCPCGGEVDLAVDASKEVADVCNPRVRKVG